MTSSGDEQLLAEMRSALDDLQTASDRMRERVRQAKTTVRDKERLLSVTVGGHGELHQIAFHGDAYRQLPPAELADVIVTTARKARDDAMRKALAGTADVTGDLFRLGNRARRATSVADLVEGIVEVVTATADEARSGGRG